jgi:3-dehydroquinate synthase
VKSEIIEICGAGFHYDAVVGRGLMARSGALSGELVRGKRCAVIADEISGRLFGQRVCQSLTAASLQPLLIAVAPGENSKTFAQVEMICGQMADAKLDRSSFVVGLGGGVIGDLSGFVAAVFHRGIPHIQIPTTLLAMVDSAIGGKTGVNLPAGKNLVGAIHHPVLVLADLDALEALPPRELRQGYAEIVKHGIIRDAEMLRRLRARKIELPELIRRNIAIKARIVSADDRETSGERALLNFGHTVGHAIERAFDFRLPHGDCISLGMLAACEISTKRASFSQIEREEVVALLRQFELPTRLPRDISRGKIIELVGPDKKFEGGAIRFVVTPRLGEAHVSRDVTIKDICAAVENL